MQSCLGRFSLFKAYPDTNHLEITSEPFQSTLTLYTPYESSRFVVFPANSFTYERVDIDEDGNYPHKPLVPGEDPWRTINLDVDPFLDQIFIKDREFALWRLVFM